MKLRLEELEQRNLTSYFNNLFYWSFGNLDIVQNWPSANFVFTSIIYHTEPDAEHPVVNREKWLRDIIILRLIGDDLCSQILPE